MEYITVTDEEKLNLLIEQDLCGVEWKSLDQKTWCLYCNRQFVGREVRIYRDGDDLMLECGTPDCDGSPLDWSEEPWWRPSAARQRV